MGSKPESEGGKVIRPALSKRARIEQCLRNARGVADSGLGTDDVMRLTRGEKVSVSGVYQDDLLAVKLVTPQGDAGQD